MRYMQTDIVQNFSIEIRSSIIWNMQEILVSKLVSRVAAKEKQRFYNFKKKKSEFGISNALNFAIHQQTSELCTP